MRASVGRLWAAGAAGAVVTALTALTAGTADGTAARPAALRLCPEGSAAAENA